MSKSNGVEFQLIDKLVKHVETYGVKKTLALLSPAAEDKKIAEEKEAYVKMVLNAVSQEFGIDLPILLDSKYIRNNGNNKFAIGFCIHYLRFKKDMNEIHQEIFKNKSATLLSKYKKIVEDLNPNFKSDKPLIEIKSKLDKIIIK